MKKIQNQTNSLSCWERRSETWSSCRGVAQALRSTSRGPRPTPAPAPACGRDSGPGVPGCGSACPQAGRAARGSGGPAGSCPQPGPAGKPRDRRPNAPSWAGTDRGVLRRAAAAAGAQRHGQAGAFGTAVCSAAGREWGRDGGRHGAGARQGQRRRGFFHPCVCVPPGFPGRGTVRPLRPVPSAQPSPPGSPGAVRGRRERDPAALPRPVRRSGLPGPSQSCLNCLGSILSGFSLFSFFSFAFLRWRGPGSPAPPCAGPGGPHGQGRAAANPGTLGRDPSRAGRWNRLPAPFSLLCSM